MEDDGDNVDNVNDDDNVGNDDAGTELDQVFFYHGNKWIEFGVDRISKFGTYAKKGLTPFQSAYDDEKKFMVEFRRFFPCQLAPVLSIVKFITCIFHKLFLPFFPLLLTKRMICIVMIL